MTLRQAADRLDIESWRVMHLSRFLGLDAYTYLLPCDAVESMASVSDQDDRYDLLRDWLLHHPRQYS